MNYNNTGGKSTGLSFPEVKEKGSFLEQGSLLQEIFYLKKRQTRLCSASLAESYITCPFLNYSQSRKMKFLKLV